MLDPLAFDDPDHRLCPRCREVKPLDDFSATLRANGSVKFSSYCAPCRRAYQHEWYVAHREQALAASAARREAERSKRPPKPPPVEHKPLRDAIGFRTNPNPRKQGNAGLAIAIAYLTRIGLDVAIPLTDTQPYDLIIDDRKRLARVQVKTTTTRDPRLGHYRVTVQSIGRNNSGVVRRKFDPSAYEWLFVVCGDGCCYMIPSGAITARTVFFLTRSYEAFLLTDEESG